jgi:hypothetical protein
MSKKYTLLLIEDDKDSADEYLEDAETYLPDATVKYEFPPQNISVVVDLVKKYDASAVVVDERLRQHSEANYIGIDVLNYLNNAIPNLPVVILTEYERDPDLRKVPAQQLFRKYHLLNDEGKKYHFDVLMDMINQYLDKQNEVLEQKKVISGTNEINVREIARLHFLMDDSIEIIVWFQNKERKEIQLIEVNRTALPIESIEPFLIPKSEEIAVPLLIADVAPREWEKIQKGEIKLPYGWELTQMEVFNRDETVKE